jgi:hypothetical protein
VAITGAAAQQLADLTQIATGTTAAVITGTSDVLLDLLTQLAAGTTLEVPTSSGGWSTPIRPMTPRPKRQPREEDEALLLAELV